MATAGVQVLTPRQAPQGYTWSLYPYEPTKIAPPILAAILLASALIHGFQNYRYSYWRVTFFMFYGGLIFTAGWILREISAFQQQNIGVFIAQIVLIFAAPPVYAAAEYNILGRLMHYLPMHAPLNPSRVFYVFLYLGILVESLTGAGAGRSVTSDPDSRRSGTALLAASLVLQSAVEVLFMTTVALMHVRASRAGMLAPNVRTIVFTLYGTSSMILIRCIVRAVEIFQKLSPSCDSYYCGTLSNNEWGLYVFECLPMILYTLGLNLFHPGRYLPVQYRRYLDLDGQTERDGPGWIDKRSKWKTFVDPFDVRAAIHGRTDEQRFWERPQEWPKREESFALGTADNKGKISSADIRNPNHAPFWQRRSETRTHQSKQATGSVSEV